MTQSAEDVFFVRIFERKELEKERHLNRVRREIDQQQTTTRRIEELKPELKKAVKKALKRLRESGWPNWQGGELRQATDKSERTEERAVWRLAQVGGIYAFLGSDGLIYGGTPNAVGPLVEIIRWESSDALERVINRIKKLQEESKS